MLVVCVSMAFAQGTATIKTSAICGMCKATIEKALNKQAGVSAVNMDVDTKEITVSFDDKKTNVSKIRKAISKAGYDADEVKRNQKSFAKLPACCKGETKMKENSGGGDGVKGTKEKVKKKGCCAGESKKSGCNEL
ncbi:MAG: hypothetical protein EAZ85_14925 [Bacteroidetes bacterium]|nr:MAG: hypothetical protein EAZ85_14925 [Bacteroidota bacterium]TAG87034.1 MAG: hypothetical protein EAZ20_11520 [Bacteroidota bacterium]